MIIKISPNREIERNVEIIDYDLTNECINIDYNIIVSYKDKTTKVRGISIFLIKDDFSRYKDLPINEMLEKILNDYL